MTKKIIQFLLAFALLFTNGCKSAKTTQSEQPTSETSVIELTETSEEETQESEIVLETVIDEHGSYTSMEDVCAYLLEYNHLPDNYITKNEATKLGWDSSKGNLNDVAPGKSIGGDKFKNYEKILPEDNKYYECDIDYEEGYRNAKRIIFTKDGHIYYTEDHYTTFIELAPEEGTVWK